MLKHSSWGLLAAIFCLIALPALGQVYGGLDGCGGGYGNNGLRVYFDESVDASCGGIIANPIHWAISSTPTPSAYLVLINPTASQLNLWQCDFRMEGQGVVLDSFFYGDPAANLGSGDTFVIFFNSPMPLEADHVPLARFDLALEAGTNPESFPFGRMDFFLEPATGEDQEAPGYFNGSNQFIASHSLTSNFHGWDVPCMILNSNEGVTEVSPASWDHLKALYR